MVVASLLHLNLLISNNNNLISRQGTLAHRNVISQTASGNICACVKLLVDGIFVMAKSCPEALSRESFWHTYSTRDVYFLLETLT